MSRWDDASRAQHTWYTPVNSKPADRKEKSQASMCDIEKGLLKSITIQLQVALVKKERTKDPTMTETDSEQNTVHHCLMKNQTTEKQQHRIWKDFHLSRFEFLHLSSWKYG